MQCPLDHRRQTPPIRRLQGKILSIFDEFQPAYALLTPVAVGRKWTSTNGSKIFSALRGLPSSTLLYAPAAACLLGACFPLTASSRLSIFAGGSLGLALATRKGTKIVGLVLACSCFALLTARAPKPLKSLERGLGAARVRVLENRSAVQRDGSIAQRALVEVEAGRHLNMQRSIEPGTRLWVQDCDLPPQTVARVTLDVRPRAQPRNPDVMVHWPQRAHGSARLVGQPVVLERSALLERLFAMRAQLRTNLLRDLSQRSAAFVAALTLGDQALVGPTDYASVQAAGVAHILAVSGLHIGAASLVTLWLIRHTLLALVLLAPALARFNIRRATHIVAAPLALVHGLLAGGSPSALRASWIVAAAHVLVFLGRRPAARSMLAVIPLLAAAYDASLLRRPAFALSMTACLVLAHTVDNMNRMRREPLRQLVATVKGSFRTSANISVATLPIVATCFGNVAWVGVVSNVVFIPLTTVVLLPAVHLQLILSAIGMGRLLSHATEGTAHATLEACAALARWAPPLLLPSLTVPETAALICLCIAYFCRWKAGIALCLLAALALCAPRLAQGWKRAQGDQLDVIFFDVGQGDASLIVAPNGHVAMVDIGRSMHFGKSDTNAWRTDPVAHALRKRSVQTIDLLVISHAHPDHFAAWSALSEQVRIRELWLPLDGHRDESAAFQRLVQNAKRRGAKVRIANELCESPQRRLGNVTFDVISPCTQTGTRPDRVVGSLNNSSLVVRLRFGRRSVLYTGDIEAQREQDVVDKTQLQADIVKVPHHGSRTSSSEAFVDAVAPTVAVISAGAGNPFGHPAPSVVARWKRRACVLLTAEVGGVHLRSDGTRWQIVNAAQAKHCRMGGI